MRLTPPPTRLWLIGLIVLPTLGCLHTPMCWSPDGEWLAYTVAVRPRDEVLAPGWMFEKVTPEATKAALSGKPQAAKRRLEGLTYRLWASRPETGESVLLEECAGPLTSPGWSPDGSALAFGRLVPEGGGRARFEIVLQDAPNHQRVLQSRPIAQFQAEADAGDLPALGVDWSPDGRYLAVPQFQPRGLAILRADNGRLLKSVDDGYLPAWSPDGTKVAYFRRGEGEGLYCIDANFGSPRLLTGISKATQAPVWARDNQSVVVVRRKSRSGRPDQSTEQAELVRVRIDTGRVESLKAFTGDPAARVQAFRGVSFGFDRDGEELFYSALVDGQPSSITWYRMREGATYKLFNPFDIGMPLGGLAVSPVGKKLALRVGPADVAASPAVCDLDTDRLTPVVPDDDARLEWLATTISAARQILLTQVPAPLLGNEPLDRPTLLPAPGEIPMQQETILRLRRLARIGRSLCDRPADAPADAALQEILDEARLFFDYLKQDYPSAIASLEAVEARATSADRRARLLILRAQIFIGMGDSERAQGSIAYLQSIQPRPVRQIEMTPAGPALTTDSRSAEQWADFLALRSEAIKHGQVPGEGPEQAFENPNPDAPVPGLGLDPADGLFPIQRMDGQAIPFRLERGDMNDLIPGVQPPPPQPPMQLNVRPMIPILPRAQPKADSKSRK